MSETMKVQPFGVLLHWILRELEENDSIFGIHRSLFFRPNERILYGRENYYGHYLATPIGPAAGPHTQLSQNIVCSWLSGGRFIELKTVQVMDELEIPRPCIDMTDEGYNVEWSQELKLGESATEYVNAWALIHILRRILGFEEKVPFGTIFNMSVGYNLEGIQSPTMTRFMDRMEDASEEIDSIRTILKAEFPRFADIEIPPRLTNSVTLSTMHGCPPDEIEKIARYLLEERSLHTAVKMNPTLLGKETVARILHEDLGFKEIQVPEATFEHDLKYDRAVELIRTLQSVAGSKGLTFGVKLSNTLPTINHLKALPGEEMYMSGRALFPITLNLFDRLSREFDGELDVSYSGGADALNVGSLLASGARSVTAVTDLLKPGGYSRMLQYLENVDEEMRAAGASSLEEFAKDRSANLERAAADSLANPRYRKGYHPYDLPKVLSGLDLIDCVTAPCVEPCAVAQDVPEYARLIARGEYDKALEVILVHNPLPSVTGYICTNLCQTLCTRTDNDEPVAIRALKRFAVENGDSVLLPSEPTGHRVAIIGGGPSGLAAAFYLARNGVRATIFEAKEVAGGMLVITPPFRLPRSVVEWDIDRIVGLGVEIKLSSPITAPPEDLLAEGYDAVYVACGFQKDSRLEIEGTEGEGVFHSLDLMEKVARGEKPDLGSRALVIGGGNTAMDATRTAQRITGCPVTVVYRRGEEEMPASREEREEVLEEGNKLVTLASPVRVIREKNRVIALECVRTRLGDPDESGRRRPVPIEGSEFLIDGDSIIVAIGQAPDVAFLDGSALSLEDWGGISVESKTGLAGGESLYAGGDAIRGPATIVEACGDGRRAARAICAKLGLPLDRFEHQPPPLSKEEIVAAKRVRARKVERQRVETLPLGERGGFDLVEGTLAESAAREEAARCVLCSHFCDKCVEVCPNRANFTYLVPPGSVKLPLISCVKRGLEVVGEELFHAQDSRQIIHLDDFCNECGNCATFCVHHGKPYLEKPRLFLKEEDFLLERGNAFLIEGNVIRRREGGRESRLSVDGEKILFENEHVRIRLSPGYVIGDMELKETFEGTLSLKGAVEMAIILQGVTSSAAYLIT